jgi:hypothetical protein
MRQGTWPSKCCQCPTKNRVAKPTTPELQVKKKHIRIHKTAATRTGSQRTGTRGNPSCGSHSGGYSTVQYNRMIRQEKVTQHGEYTIQSISCTTPWRRVLPEKRTRPQLVKKFPAFYGTRRFITAFITARHLSLSWATAIQSMPPNPNY